MFNYIYDDTANDSDTETVCIDDVMVTDEVDSDPDTNHVDTEDHSILVFHPTTPSVQKADSNHYNVKEPTEADILAIEDEVNIRTDDTMFIPFADPNNVVGTDEAGTVADPSDNIWIGDV